jgi:formylglycine-generating enzyme required for sulfatase activity
VRRFAFFSLALIGFAACSTFSDSEDPSVDGGAGDAATDATAEGSNNDGTAPFDGGTDAPVDAIPPGMVVISTSLKSFLIDSHEVTIAEFTDYKEKVSVLDGGNAAFPSVCAFKLGLGPQTSGYRCNEPAGSNVPVRCVDWCDAFVYCRDHGKRLCGAISGGTSVNPVDALSSQWVRACAGGTNAAVYPYGAEDTTKCNVNGNQLHDVGSHKACEGSVPGLFDMSGNAAELDDSCTGDGGDGGANDTCFAHGGSAGSSAGGARCDIAESRYRGDSDFLTGFRCCKDL